MLRSVNHVNPNGGNTNKHRTSYQRDLETVRRHKENGATLTWYPNYVVVSFVDDEGVTIEETYNIRKERL